MVTPQNMEAKLQLKVTSKKTTMKQKFIQVVEIKTFF